jgi:flagellar hook-length control protein FliK
LVGKAAPPDDALKAEGLPETSDKEDATAVQADSKTESGKAKADHPGAARAPDAQPHPNATKAATYAAPEPQPKAVPHQQLHETAERASLTARAGAADARPELPVTAAPQAQIHTGGPLPFGLAVHAASPLAALSPLTALRIDAPADNAVPVAGLAVEFVSRAQDGLRRFDIRLDPPELGRIDVRLDVDTAGKVTSRLTVERAETLDLLRRDAPQLERALQHAGLNTEGGLEFSLRDQNFANREQAPRNPAAAQLIVSDDEVAAAEAARRGYGRMIGLGGGVDIRV